MREMVLTGVANEQSFTSDMGEMKFLLVFNHGELRVPVDQSALQLVLEHMAEKPNGNGHHRASEDVPSQDVPTDYEDQQNVETDDDGVGQI